MAKYNSQSKSKIIFGYIMLVMSLVLFALTVVPNWAITKIALGSFGVVWYGSLTVMFLFSIANVLALKFSYTKKFTFFLTFSIFSLVCILHIIFSNALLVQYQGFENFKNYLSACYNMTNGLTVGGAFIGISVYCVRALFGIVGVYAIFVMLLAISFGVVLDSIIYGTTRNTKPMKKIVFTQPKKYLLDEKPVEKNTEFYEDDKSFEQNEFDKPEEQVNSGLIFDNTLNSEPVETEEEKRRRIARETLFARDVPDITIKDDSERDRWMRGYQKQEEPEEKQDDDLGDIFGRNNGSIFGRDSSFDRNSGIVERRIDDKEDDEPISSRGELGRVPGRINQREPLERNRIVRDNIFDSQPHTLGAEEENVAPALDLRKQATNDLRQQPATDSWQRPKPAKRESPNQIGMKSVRYNAIPINIFAVRKEENEDYSAEQHKKAAALEKVMSEFGVNAKVINVVRGPKVTRYEMSLPTGIPTTKVTSIESNISMALEATSIRIEAPIPGKNAIGVELQNDKATNVGMRELLESPEFVNSKDPLPIAIGKDISGAVIIKSLPKMVHALVAGSTGSGKSVFIHSVVMSILYKYSPDQVRFIMIDPKMVEFSNYNKLPHLMLPDVLVDHDKALNALKWAISEMMRRYNLLKENEVRNIEGFNNLPDVKNGKVPKLPYLVILVDELAELMGGSFKKDFENAIQRIAQLGRAAGIHMVVATQRPSVDVVTGTIKNNFPTRVAFALSSGADSKTILDEYGAEKLLGRGDMLFAPQDSNRKIRLQAAYCTDEEIAAAVKYVKSNNEAYYDEEIANAINTTKTEQSEDSGNASAGGDETVGNGRDPLFKAVCQYAKANGKVSTSLLQRKFRLGFGRAARIVDELVELGFAGPNNGSKPRDFSMTDEQFEELFGADADSDSEF